VLPPDLSTTFLIEFVLPLVIGFAVGFLIKKALTVGLIVAVVVSVLIILGFLAPGEVLKPLIGFLRSGSAEAEWVNRVAGYLPYTSVTFVVGLVIGLMKG